MVTTRAMCALLAATCTWPLHRLHGRFWDHKRAVSFTAHSAEISNFAHKVTSGDVACLRRQAANHMDSVLMATAAVKVGWTQGMVVESPFASMAEDTTPDVSLATTRESSNDESGVTVLPSSPVCTSAVYTSVSALPPALCAATASCGGQAHNPSKWPAGDNSRR